jgi:hypothetical protein
VSLASRDRLSFPGFFARCCNPNSDPQSYVRTATRPTSRFKVTVMKQWILSTNAIVLSAVSGAAPAALHANARQRVKILEQSLSYAEEATVFLPLAICRHYDEMVLLRPRRILPSLPLRNVERPLCAVARLRHRCAQWRSG